MQASYHISRVASIIQGQVLQQSADNPIEYLLIDSRKLVFPGSSLFFALKGLRRDGHAFIRDLYARGVMNFVVSDRIALEDLPGTNIIHVPDTLNALQSLAAFHRCQFSIPVIGITGSNGKTIVKEWLNQLLEGTHNIVRSPKSYNSQVGVPLSVWQMNETHTLGIFEAGISEPGEMDKLENIIAPTIGIFTNVGEAHSEGFADDRHKAKEKMRLFKNVSTLIYCEDQALIRELVKKKGSDALPKSVKVFPWGRRAGAGLQILETVAEGSFTRIVAMYHESEISITIPFTDAASVENAIHCWCVMLNLEFSAQTIAEHMPRLGPVAMRLELKSGINNCSVINDSYSADLSSLRIALDFLANQSQHSDKTVILSDILQSGRTGEDLYREVAELLNRSGINRLLAVGEGISRFHSFFRAIPNAECLFYQTTDALLSDFPRLHFREETILLKGARIFEFERISQRLEHQFHQTVMEINLNAIVHNLKQYQQLLHPSVKVMAMVKAFAYGSGSCEIASVLQFHKVDYLAVAYADEGVALRRAGITLPIMVMNPDEPALGALVHYDLEPEIYSLSSLRLLESFLKREGIRQFPVHVELETGMNRLGFAFHELNEALPLLQSETFKVQSVFSHLVASEDPQHDAFTAQQAQLFDEMSARLQAALSYPFLRHLANSAAIVRHPQLQLDMVRLGIGLYGINEGTHLDLKEVSTLTSTVSQVKRLHEGDTVSYGRRGIILRDSQIATVRIGYADGYPRSLSNGNGKMWINGQLAPIVGAVCMDMTMIDVTGIPDVHEGDRVVVFGSDLPVAKVAAWAQTIPYEILTGVSQRVKRIYFEE